MIALVPLVLLVWLTVACIKLIFSFWAPIQNFELLFQSPLLWVVLGGGLISWILNSDRP